MALFKLAEETKSGLKVLAFGDSGSGKTSFALSFPKIVAIDSEDGMAWYKGRERGKNLKYILNTTSADEVEEALEEIEEELIGEIDTFVVDSETKIYENQQHGGLELAEKRARTKGQSVDDANLSQREWGKIKLIGKRMQSSKIKIASMGVNVISIAQEKAIKEKKGENWIITGYEPDTGKGLKYDYDLVLRLYTEEKDGEELFKARVIKDRTEVTKKGQILDNPSYEIWRDVVEGKQNKKEEVIDFKKDIKRDEIQMLNEYEAAEKMAEELREIIGKATKEDKSKIISKCKELKIENPLKCDDISAMSKLMDFVKKM
ncbi:AAA family ATPase [Clostridium perfringens]|uniref:AAA family ATPase n=1 Tax=Clostridium perfringens TaxID=1502 RepID=UPI0024BC999C|nr:AAA family ATPase [Clostridium perfringens]